jgi:hypothetical protein
LHLRTHAQTPAGLRGFRGHRLWLLRGNPDANCLSLTLEGTLPLRPARRPMWRRSICNCHPPPCLRISGLLPAGSHTQRAPSHRWTLFEGGPGRVLLTWEPPLQFKVRRQEPPRTAARGKARPPLSAGRLALHWPQARASPHHQPPRGGGPCRATSTRDNLHAPRTINLCQLLQTAGSLLAAWSLVRALWQQHQSMVSGASARLPGGPLLAMPPPFASRPAMASAPEGHKDTHNRRPPAPAGAITRRHSLRRPSWPWAAATQL